MVHRQARTQRRVKRLEEKQRRKLLFSERLAASGGIKPLLPPVAKDLALRELYISNFGLGVAFKRVMRRLGLHKGRVKWTRMAISPSTFAIQDRQIIEALGDERINMAICRDAAKYLLQLRKAPQRELVKKAAVIFGRDSEKEFKARRTPAEEAMRLVQIFPNVRPRNLPVEMLEDAVSKAIANGLEMDDAARAAVRRARELKVELRVIRQINHSISVREIALRELRALSRLPVEKKRDAILKFLGYLP